MASSSRGDRRLQAIYGTLTVNADGSYSYVPNAAAINALPEGSYADKFTVQTTDVHGAHRHGDTHGGRRPAPTTRR